MILPAIVGFVLTPLYLFTQDYTMIVVFFGLQGLFAAGSIFHELLSGRPAFESDGLVAVMQRILNQEPPSLGGSAGIDAADGIIQRSWSRSVSARYCRPSGWAPSRSFSLRPRRPRTRPTRWGRGRPISKAARVSGSVRSKPPSLTMRFRTPQRGFPESL